MNKDHREVVDRIEHKIDKLEQKLDKYLMLTSSQEADIGWVKGYIRMSVGLVMAMVASIVSLFFKIFIVK